MGSVIAIVSGLPRTGTSMMMRMLEAGGLDALVDDVRKADEDNPQGYYEFEDVKKIKDDASWLDRARGRAVKMVSMLLPELPAAGSDGERYKVVFMERDLAEAIESQNKMLARMGKASAEDDEATRRRFEAHLADIKGWLGTRPDIEVLYVAYRDVIDSPLESARKVASFIGGLDAAEMAAVVDKSLYRNRADAAGAGSRPWDADAQHAGSGDEDEEAVMERLKSLGYM